ncbi:methyl-accepting chemotaxis protein [Peptococcaceae bacterium 1198_IL3148]
MKVRIGTKIAGGYVALIVLLLVLGVYSYNVSHSTIEHLENIDVYNQRLGLEKDIQAEYYAVMASIRGYTIAADEKRKEEYRMHMENVMQMVGQLQDIAAEKNKSKVVDLNNLLAEYDQSVTEMLMPAVEQKVKGQNSEQDAAYVEEQFNLARSSQSALGSELESIIAGLVKENSNVREQYMFEAKDNSTTVQRYTIIFAVLTVVVGVVLAIVLTNMIRKPILELTEDANRFAEGDFSQQIQVKSSDEIGDLAGTFNNMAQKLGAMIADMGHHAQTLAAHSEELAASGEEVNATVEEMASTSSEVAATAAAGFANAEKTVTEAKKVAQVALAGNETVKQTVVKINAIATSAHEVEKSVENLHDLSNQIGKITNVITGIAEQTNLLALNAAIEAARAGEHGKGFAVVADEVRKLAEQSANATKEIAQLIDQVQTGAQLANSTMKQAGQEVEDGVRLASEAGQALAEIVASTNGTIEMIEDIKEGNQQSSEGMEQVAASNEQITSTTQQISSATQELAEIANQMQLAVAQFKVATE